MIALLNATRPRGLYLARWVSSWTIFVGVLLILTSLFTIEAVAQSAPRNLTAEAQDGRIVLKWEEPVTKGPNFRGYQWKHTSQGNIDWANTGDQSTTFVVDKFPNKFGQQIVNGTSYTLHIRAWSQTAESGPSNSVTATPNIDAPTNLRATVGDGEVTLNWIPIPDHTSLPSTLKYQYQQGSGAWEDVPSSTRTTASHPVTELTNGIPYTFKVRAHGRGGGGKARSVTVTPLRGAPGAPGTLNVERDKDTAILTWSAPSDAEEDIILRYEYSDDGGSTWKSTGSSDTTYTATGLEAGETYTFVIRAVYVDGRPSRIISFHSTSSNSAVLNYPKPKRQVIRDCPVGWMRSDRFAGRTRRALLYEVKLEMDIHNPVSIYKPVSVAIYVHPNEGLETLEGWKLQVAVPYNHHREYPLTAENSVVVDSEVEGIEGGFAFIKSPEAESFPMVGMGFTGRLAPGFDYRLYDDRGKRVDFGIACYKRSDIFQVLKDMEAPSVLRKVDLETFDWNAPYLRSEWTVPVLVNVPGAPPYRVPI